VQLEKVTIERFRSIEKAKIKGCGGFNVLIGKNNSGKSNILSAMRSFFDLVQGGNAVTLDPPVGEEIDFFERATQQPIDITLIALL
jgi:predicted ATP-dependent endonuclease of OLD family